MRVSYKKLWKLLIDLNMSKSDLRKETGLATGTPTDSTKLEDPTKSEKPDSPQTGDNSMMALWISVLFVSGFGVVATAVYGKKRKSVK